MKIHYLGTGAAEGIPAIFCHCRICENARRKKGKEIRSRLQAIIDDRIIIDFGPDTFFHSLSSGTDFAAIELCLITHSHPDHLIPSELFLRKSNNAIYDYPINPLNVYGSTGVREQFKLFDNGYITKDGRSVFHTAEPFSEILFGEYRITPLPAIHNTEQPLIYLIQKNNTALLYAHDTDVFSDEVWDWFRKSGIRLDCVSLDCTEGAKQIDYRGHMNLERDYLVKRELIESGAADSKTVFVAGHFSHNGLLSHEELCAQAEGFIISYDGMILEFGEE
ncbi:MAG: MBL fold metallo-hydrolase [Oscillospiraceae bacterium]